MAGGQPLSDRDELSRSLLALRKSAGLHQTAVAAAAGLSQSQVSRAEQGRRLLDPEEVARFAKACKAPSAERARLVRLARDVQAGHVNSRVIMQRGAHHFQERIRNIEEGSALIRGFQPGLVLGVLQTEDYAAAVFGQGTEPDDQVVASVASRRARNLQLADPSRRWVLIQTTGALTWQLRSPAVMADQMDRLREASLLPNVRLGVIPAMARADFTVAHGFHLYDRRAVLVATKTATALINDPADIATYEKLFSQLEQLAVYDDECRDLLNKLATGYREMSNSH